MLFDVVNDAHGRRNTRRRGHFGRRQADAVDAEPDRAGQHQLRRRAAQRYHERTRVFFAELGLQKLLAQRIAALEIAELSAFHRC